jgi:hypothetical protein
MDIPTLTPAQAARRLAGRRVWVSRNLRMSGPDGEPVWSLRATVDGRQRVVCRTTAVVLADVETRVRKADQRRALTDGHRNVHAFVVGTVTPAGAAADDRAWVACTYDLWGAGAFVCPAGRPVVAADAAVLDADGLRMASPR